MSSLVPKPENLAPLVFLLRGERVLIDADLASLYGVTTKVLNQAVKRNTERFPDDFMFRLTAEDQKSMRSQIVTGLRRNVRHPPYAFTEQGWRCCPAFCHLPARWV